MDLSVERDGDTIVLTAMDTDPTNACDCMCSHSHTYTVYDAAGGTDVGAVATAQTHL